MLFRSVEPAGVGAAGGINRGALRRQPDLSAHRQPVAGGFRSRRHAVRGGRRIPAGLREGRVAPRQGLPAGRTASGRLDRFTVARLGLSLGAGRRRPSNSGGVGQWWHRLGDGVHRRVSAGPDRCGRAERHVSRRRGGGLDRRGHPGGRAGRRAGAHPADAVDAGFLLERRRRQSLSQGVLRQVPGHLVPR